ncbi:MAG TPA: hypothetical protein VMH27_21110 [Puia sp.]|nr:hypothetical protein [Puia sp.]
MKPLLITAMVLLLAVRSYCQKGQKIPAVDFHAQIRVLAESCGDSIVLRWGPTDPRAWSLLNRNGYLIERIDISQPNHPVRSVITPQPLKPWTLDHFKSSFGPNNKYAAIAAQCFYGKNFNSNLRQGQPGIRDKANVWKNRYAFAMQVADFDGEVAKAEGVRLTDTKVVKGGVYIYRVYAAQPAAHGKIDTGNTLVQNQGRTSPARPRLGEIVALDRIAELHWPRSGEGQYSGFLIERSDDGTHFKTLTDLPYLASLPDTNMAKRDSVHARIATLLKTNELYIDSLPFNYHRYYYRIRGVNAFAEWSPWSDTLSTSGRDLTPPSPPVVLTPKFTKGNTLVVRWKKPVREADFKGYVVSRSHNAAAGPYTSLNNVLLPPSATEFTDTGAFAHGQNFYMVIALDTAGNMGTSLPAMGLVPDNTPPGVPKGLRGFIDRKGLVHLTWRSNPEEDVKGYKVYFANAANHVFSQITIHPTPDTTFTDSITLHTLTKSIWYKIVAVDWNNNHSPYSPAVPLKKPDLVAPVAPLAEKVYVDTAGVQIDWIQSSSEDVVRYIIYRKEGKGPWVPFASQRHDSSKVHWHFTDASVKPFVAYSYTAEAVDDDSLHSGRPTPVQATVKTVPDLPPLRTLTAEYDSKGRQVHVRWQYTNTGNYFFILYKGTAALSRYRSLGSDKSEYVDNDLPAGGGGVGYAIQVMFKDKRGQTRVSDRVAVNLPQAR